MAVMPCPHSIPPEMRCVVLKRSQCTALGSARASKYRTKQKYDASHYPFRPHGKLSDALVHSEPIEEYRVTPQFATS